MAGRNKPLFLERRRYRLRRLMDTVRLMPVIGGIAWLLPLLWPVGMSGQTDSIPMSHALYYIFSVWMALILIGWGLWLRLRTETMDIENPPVVPPQGDH
jgi:hypothetical protein